MINYRRHSSNYRPQRAWPAAVAASTAEAVKMPCVCGSGSDRRVFGTSILTAPLTLLQTWQEAQPRTAFQRSVGRYCETQ